MNAQPIDLSPRNLPDTVKAGKKISLHSIGAIHRFMGNSEDPDSRGAFEGAKIMGASKYSSGRRGNQWLSCTPMNETFKAANKRDKGKYHVSTDPSTDETHRIELPRVLVGFDGNELATADAKNTALSYVLLPDLMADKKGSILAVATKENIKLFNNLGMEFTIIRGSTMDVEYNRAKKEYLYTVSNPSAWFALAMPAHDDFFDMILDENGTLKGFTVGRSIFTANSICFSRSGTGINNGLLTRDYWPFNGIPYFRHSVLTLSSPSSLLRVLGTGFGAENVSAARKRGVSQEKYIAQADKLPTNGQSD